MKLSLELRNKYALSGLLEHPWATLTVDFGSYVASHPWGVLGLALYFLAKRSKGSEMSEVDIVKMILENYNLIYEEQTKEPDFETVNGVRKKRVDEFGKVVYKIRYHKPRINFQELPKSFRLRNVHEKVQKYVMDYGDGIISSLFHYDVIPKEYGVVRQGTLPGEFIFDLLNEKEVRDREALKRVGWYETRGPKRREYYPTVIHEKDSKKFIIRCDNCNIPEDMISKGISLFGIYYDLELKKSFEKEGRDYILHYAKKLNPIFPFGVGINESEETINRFEDNFIIPVREKFNKKKTEHLILGEVFDPEIEMNPLIMVDLGSSPHFLVGGQTSSGKSRTIVSLVLQAMIAYPDSEFIFADGKNGGDYNAFAKAKSVFPVAVKNTAVQDPLVEFVNVINYTYNKYLERKAIRDEFSNTHQQAVNYAEYNQLRLKFRPSDPQDQIKYDRKFPHFPRVFLVIDEFKEFIDEAGESMDHLIGKKGNPFSLIRSLLAASRSEGFSILIASQRIQATDFPTPIRSNLTNWIIHSMTPKDAIFTQTSEENSDLSKGAYILQSQGLYDPVSKKKNIICRLPFVGESEDVEAIMKHFNVIDYDIKKRKFDMDIITNFDTHADIPKKDIQTLHKEMRRLFFHNEGFEILEDYSPLHSIICFVVTHEQLPDVKIGISLIDNPVELEETVSFTNRFRQERSHDYSELLVLVICTAPRVSGGTKRSLRESNPRTSVILPHEIRRPLAIAHSDYQDDKKSYPFLNLIHHTFQQLLEEEGILEIKPKQKPLDQKILESFDMDTESKEEKKLKKDDEHEALARKIVTVSNLKQIMRIKNSDKKGRSFEKFCLELEYLLGHDSESGYRLIERGKLKNIFSNSRKDGGLDIVRWVDREKRIVDIIQCKNVPSRPLDIKVLNKLTKTKFLYSSADDITIRKMVLYSSNRLTSQAYAEADAMKIEVYSGQKLIDLVEKLNP